MSKDDLYTLAPGAAGSLAELDIARRARHMHDAWLLAGSIRSQFGWQSGPPGTPVQDLHAGRQHALDSLRQVAADTEPAYLLAQQHLLERPDRLAQRGAFLSHFCRRLLYVGTDVVPRTWSHIGWVDDYPDWPVAIPRDCGHIILVSGIQGSGKGVLSTVLCEGCQQAEEPISSAQRLPTCYAFFHIEQQERSVCRRRLGCRWGLRNGCGSVQEV